MALADLMRGGTASCSVTPPATTSRLLTAAEPRRAPRGRMGRPAPTAEELAEAAEVEARKRAAREAAIAVAVARTRAKFGHDPSAMLLASMFPGGEMLSAGVVSESGIPGPEEPPPAPLGWIHGPDAWYGVAGSRVRHAAWHRRHEAQGPHRKTYLDIALFADRLNSNGWPWYPQARVGKRRPIGSYEKTDPTGEDKCRGISPKWLAEEAATPARTAEWIRQLRDTKKRANAALALGGAASLHMLALDGDAKDPRIAKTLRDLAREHLPATPYARGRHDSAKFALLYRGSPDDPCTRVQGVTFKSTPEFGKAQLEILAQPNKSITIHGRHHEETPCGPGRDSFPASTRARPPTERP